MTPEHALMLQHLAQAGRLGDYCPWPWPKGYPKDRDPVISPKLAVRDEAGNKVKEVPPYELFPPGNFRPGVETVGGLQALDAPSRTAQRVADILARVEGSERRVERPPVRSHRKHRKGRRR